jgi:Uma2 family endonuclease
MGYCTPADNRSVLMATAESAVTPEDLLKIRDRPMPELVDGQMVEREPMGQEADAIAATIIALLKFFVKPSKLGVVNGSQGGYRIFSDDPSKVRIPDVSFTRRERFGGQRPAKGHGTVVPDLVVEVISPNDLASDLRAKVQDFFSAGVRMIWLVDPVTRTVEVLRNDKTAAWLGEGDEIDGSDVLPGFRCKVSEIFEID